MDESGVQHSAWSLPGPESGPPGVDELPFSFVYDGRPSAEILPSWRYQVRTEALGGGRRQ